MSEFFQWKLVWEYFPKGFKCFAGYVDDSSSGVDYRSCF